MNKQSNLFIYTEFVLYKSDCFYFYVSVFRCVYVCVCVCLCVLLIVFVCMYVLSMASILTAFVFSLFCPHFSKMIRVIHQYYLPKNPCKREESLWGILSLESQTSFTCNQKFLVCSVYIVFAAIDRYLLIFQFIFIWL